MNRTLLGGLAALLMVAAGVFWWQGRAAVERNAPPPEVAASQEEQTDADLAESPEGLPTDHASKRGAALPEETEASKEQHRFDRYDRDHDGRITTTELLAPRVKAFKKLDINGDNLLSFDEWSIATRKRFKKMDLNGDGVISPQELAASKKPAKRKQKCKCAAPPGD